MAERELVALDQDESGNPIWGYADDQSLEAMGFLKPGALMAPRIPGYNVDKLDVDAGIAELIAIGYTEACTVMVINLALLEWARGEEAKAEKHAIDRNEYGIDLTSWRRVLAAAMAGGNR